MLDAGRSPQTLAGRACDLLLYVCRRGDGQKPDPPSDEGLADPVLRSEILALAARHRVLGLLLHALADHVAPDPELSELYRHCRRRSAVFELRRDQLVGLLRAQGISVVVLKGAALTRTVYDDPVQRDQADLDLLVHREDLLRAIDALASAGYRRPPPFRFEDYLRYHFHIPLRHPGAHITEIHWAMARSASPFHLDPRAVLDQAIESRRSGSISLSLPRPEHLLLHIVLQNLQERFSCLGRQVDIDRIVTCTPTFDWQYLLAAARNGGLQIPTALSLQLARSMLDTPVPEDQIRALIPSRLARYHLAIMHPRESLLAQRLPDTLAASQLQEFWLVHGARRRLRKLFTALRPSAAENFPDTKHLGSAARLLGLCKAAILQLVLYVRAGVRHATRSGRAQMRFWSSQASSSERL